MKSISLTANITKILMATMAAFILFSCSSERRSEKMMKYIENSKFNVINKLHDVRSGDLVCVLTPYSNKIYESGKMQGEINKYLYVNKIEMPEGKWAIIINDGKNIEIDDINTSIIDIANGKYAILNVINIHGIKPGICSYGKDAYFIKISYGNRAYMVFGRYL